MATFLPDTLVCFPYDPTDTGVTSANCVDAGYSGATSCGVIPTGPLEYNDPWDPNFQPYKQSYGLSEILVTFNTNKKDVCAHAI